ncbi:class II aldolase/adducin family protein [bacterium]|nr:class II aldolase/adducin family protein [bacterium]
MTRKEMEQLIIEYGKKMWQKNLTPGTSGNISCRYDDKILITASGSANSNLKNSDIVLMDYDGFAQEDETKKPSSEKLMHIAIYKKRPDLNVILHVHSPYLCSFAAAHVALDKPVMAENTFYFGKIPLAEYALPSSAELAENTAKFFDEYDAVLMANHGFVVASNNIEDAYNKLEIAESYAQIVLNTYLLGGAKLLTSEQEKEVLSLRG